MKRLLSGCLVGALLLGTSCLDVSGGAVEVSWVIRDTRQRGAGCDSNGLQIVGTPIARVRLQVQLVAPDGTVGEDLCAAGVVAGCEWDCKNKGGTTPFDIPVPNADPQASGDADYREYVFSLVPLSGDGTPIDSSIVQVPPPVRRYVRKGDLVDLGLWMMVVPAEEDVDDIIGN